MLAGDLPFLTAADLELLALAGAGHDGAVLADGDGRAQWLCGVYRSAALARRLRALGDPAGHAVRRLVADLDLVLVARPDAAAPAWYDCDTEDDYRRAGDLA